MKENRYIRNSQLVVIIASSLLILLLGLVAYVSGPGQEWRKLQREYNILSDSLLEGSSEKGIFQFELDQLSRTDRCITCHTGIENPAMENAPQPFRSHPGDYLRGHPVEKYGCTICHGGQGRALSSLEAHAIDEEIHWEHPVLAQPYLQSSCGKCHLSLFENDFILAGTDEFNWGMETFRSEGCLGCHKARGAGGMLGPDLTEQGEKTRKEYSFDHITSEQTISNWLKEHFRDPEMVSPGSQMLKIDLPEEDLEALSTFVMGLENPDISFEYLAMNTLLEFKGERRILDGNEAFAFFCSACHGKQGEGKDYKDFKVGVPAVLGKDIGRVASKDFGKFTLLKGRSRRQMSSWNSRFSGISEEELDKLAEYLFPTAEKRTSVLILHNKDRVEGEKLFKRYCETCHGFEGKGGVALALNNEDLLRNADNLYLYNTILLGRKGDAMPGWEGLGQDSLEMLVTYLRSWQAYSPVIAHMNFDTSDPVEGKIKFHFNCSRCHGEAGQGQTGPAIMNRSFLEVVENHFLYATISTGRDHSSMFGWSTDLYNSERLDTKDIGDIIVFMREYASSQAEYIYAGSNPGDWNKGQTLFADNCAECHGIRGEGIQAPALNNQEFLSAASNGFLLATITIGREGTAMPEWGRTGQDNKMLTGKEREDIVAFIRRWERVRIGF